MIPPVGHARLVRDGTTLSDAEIARTRSARRRGLLGRAPADHVLVLAPCRGVHTVGMRFAIAVAWCDGTGRVLRVRDVAPGRMTRWVRRARFVVEAEAGTARRWELAPGQVLRLTEA